MKVNIYLETDKQCQARVQRRYGYVIKPCTLAGLRPEKVSEIVVVHIISVTYRHL